MLQNMASHLFCVFGAAVQNLVLVLVVHLDNQQTSHFQVRTCISFAPKSPLRKLFILQVRPPTIFPGRKGQLDTVTPNTLNNIYDTSVHWWGDVLFLCILPLIIIIISRQHLSTEALEKVFPQFLDFCLNRHHFLAVEPINCGLVTANMIHRWGCIICIFTNSF